MSDAYTPKTRHLTCNDGRRVHDRRYHASTSPQTVSYGSYCANQMGFDVGEFVNVGLGKEDEEYVQVLDRPTSNPQTYQIIESAS